MNARLPLYLLTRRFKCSQARAILFCRQMCSQARAILLANKCVHKFRDVFTSEILSLAKNEAMPLRWQVKMTATQMISCIQYFPEELISEKLELNGLVIHTQQRKLQFLHNHLSTMKSYWKLTTSQQTSRCLFTRLRTINLMFRFIENQ